MVQNFINLSNGLLAIKEYNLTDYKILRIQSSHCEQKLFEDILVGLSDDFLFRVAMGDEVIVYDYGAKKKTPRAIWQGLEFIKYVLHKRWKDEEYTPIYRDKNVLRIYYEQEMKKLSRGTKNKIDYYKKFFKGVINIKAITKSTKFDGDTNVLLECLK